MATKNIKNYKDIDLTFKMHPRTSELSSLKDERAINRALSNIIKMVKSDRPFDPERTPNIKNLLFEPVRGGEAVVLKERLKNAIVQFEPRVKLRQVNVIPDENRNRYRVIIQYRIRENNKEVEFRDILQRVA